MKVTEPEAVETFKPFKIEIVVENEIDLKYLWLITNIGYTHLQKAYKDDNKGIEKLKTIYNKFEATNKYDLWHILDQHMVGLK